MTADRQPLLASELAAALEWWRTAGVDHSFADKPGAWLAEPVDEAAAPVAAEAEAERVAEPEPPPLIGGPRNSWPADLASFRSWWLTEPSLSEEGTFPRISPRGEAGAELLLLVAQPEEGDRETLLSGPEGKLLDAILQASGIPLERAYFASVLPRHTPLPDLEAIEHSGMRDVVAHHIALAAPARVIAFGRLASALLPHGTAQGAAAKPDFNRELPRVPVLNARSLEALRRRPGARATFWRSWLEFSDGVA